MPSTDIFDQITRLREVGRPFAIVTVVRTADVTSAKAGAKAVIDSSGTIHGFLGGVCVLGAVRKAAAAAMAAGDIRMIRVKPAAQVVTRLDTDGAELFKSGCPSGGTIDLLIEPYRRPPTLVILGASPVAMALAQHGRLFGYRLVHGARSGDLGSVAADEMVADFALSEIALETTDFVVIAAQGKGDLDALRAALASPCAYVAMVASRKKTAFLVAKLRAEGVDPNRLAELKAPAGLDVGAIDPGEIAISILAEVVQCRRQGAIGAMPAADGVGFGT